MPSQLPGYSRVAKTCLRASRYESRPSGSFSARSSSRYSSTSKVRWTSQRGVNLLWCGEAKGLGKRHDAIFSRWPLRRGGTLGPAGPTAEAVEARKAAVRRVSSFMVGYLLLGRASWVNQRRVWDYYLERRQT
jgi:hypothetical protein